MSMPKSAVWRRVRRAALESVFWIGAVVAVGYGVDRVSAQTAGGVGNPSSSLGAPVVLEGIVGGSAVGGLNNFPAVGTFFNNNLTLPQGLHEVIGPNLFGFSPALTVTATSCGTSPTVQGNSSDLAGEITIGGGGITSCQINFAKAYLASPRCVVTLILPNTAAAGYISNRAAGNIVVSFTASLTSGRINYRCWTGTLSSGNSIETGQ